MYKDIILACITFVTAIISSFIKQGDSSIALWLTALMVVAFLTYLLLLVHRKENIDLNMHPFWSRMNYYINSKIPYVQTGNRLRKKLLVLTMTTKFTTAVKHLRKFINEKDFDACKAVNLVNSMVKEYEEQWRAARVPEIFISKFHEYHSKKASSILDYIEFVCTSNFYGSDLDKKVAILDGMLNVFHWTVIDLERANAAINGPLDQALKQLNKDGIL